MADRPRHVHGVVVTTKLGKCLLHCAVGGPGPRPAELRVAPLCQLLATMQDLAGSPPFGYAEVHGSGVVVLEGHSVIVAMLCDARDGRQSARLLGMQLLNTFGQLFRGAVASLAACTHTPSLAARTCTASLSSPSERRSRKSHSSAAGSRRTPAPASSTHVTEALSLIHI